MGRHNPFAGWRAPAQLLGERDGLLRKRLLQLIAAITFRAPWLTLSVVGALTLVSAHLAGHYLVPSTDLSDFLPERLESREIYERALRDFDSFHHVFVVFESSLPSSQAAEREAKLKEAARLFDQAIDRPDLPAEYKIKPATREYFSLQTDRLIVNLLTERDWETIEGRLSEQGVERMAKRLLALLQVSEPNRSSSRALEDPLGLDDIWRKRLLHDPGPLAIETSDDGHVLSEDGSALLMTVRPRGVAATDHRDSRDLMRVLREAAASVFERRPELRDKSRISISFLGPHVETDFAAGVILEDMKKTALVSFVLVLLLFLVAFRRPGVVLFVAITLVVGVVWTLGLTTWMVGRLTTITVSFAAVLVGLGVDFAVHIYSRYAEEHRGGAGTRLAMSRAIVLTGEGIMIGAITTAVAFFGLTLTTFAVFRELGLIVGAGILCCLAAVYLVLPSLVLVNARMWGKHYKMVRPASFGLSRVATSVMGYPRATIVVGVAATAYFAFYARDVSFSTDWSQLVAAPADYQYLKRRTEKQFPVPGPPIVAVVSGDTLQEALEANDRVYANLESGRERFDALLSYDSLRTRLPSIATQERSRERFRSRFLGEGLGKVKTRYEEAGTRAGLAPEAFRPFISRLADLGVAAEGSAESDYLRFDADAPDVLIRETQHFVTKVSVDSGEPGERRDCFRIMTLIYPRSDAWTASPPQAFFDHVSESVDNIEFTGDTVLLSQAVRSDLARDLARAIFLVGAVVYALLVLHFRSLRLAALGMLPVVCSLIWTLGTMRLLGIELNLLNAIVLPMIIGLGIDDGIHILQRYFESEDGDVEGAVRHSGRAVTITSLTTIAGFGALSLAHFQGLREMGLLTILGVGYALIATLTLLPTLLQVSGPRVRLLDAIGRDRGVEKEAGRDK